VSCSDESADALLAIAASKGDQDAFAVIMRRNKTWLYQFIRHYVTDGDEAYDVLQDSFVAAWNALSRYDPERPFRAWLRRIALNKCRDRARRYAVRNAALSLFRVSANWGADTVTDAEPERVPASQRALERLEKAIAGLPRQLKEPLVLTLLEGMSQRDAGEMLGISAKAVETRVYRAKKRLATKLDPSDLADLAARD
jgi:RNA polymerase sigma factor (sigma-70 family)